MSLHWVNEWRRPVAPLAVSLIRLDFFDGGFGTREVFFILLGFGVQVEWRA